MNTQPMLDDDDIVEYRERFPKETLKLSDERLSQLVLSTDDDLEDDEWRALFEGAKP